MDKPLSRTLDPRQAEALAALFRARGHAPRPHAKNVYVRFEVRTDGKSIFTLYTSGKLVSTVREGDAEGVALEAAVADFARGAVPKEGEGPGAKRARGTRRRRAQADDGEGAGAEAGAQFGAPNGAPDGQDGGEAAGQVPPASPGASTDLRRGTRPGLAWLLGADETGTGELIGSAVVGAALLPVGLADEADAIAGHVDTKVSRAASGWEALATRLAGLAPAGLHLATLVVSNRLFDAWSKNDLLDLCYVRLLGDLLALRGEPDADAVGHRAGGGHRTQQPESALAGLEIVIDDYGVNAALTEAVSGWRGAGARVVVQTKADDTHLAARLASVAARAARSREMEGLLAEHGRLGTGNAGNPATLAWMRRQAARSRDWPSFVKASFRTARDLHRLPEVKKRRPPGVDRLLDDASARDFLAGRLDVTRALVRGADGTLQEHLDVTAQGPVVDEAAGGPATPETPLFAEQAPAARLAARWRAAGPGWELLPVLVGGIVLAADLEAAARKDPGRIAPLLQREGGLLASWRVLVGPQADAGDPALVALARAHRAGIVTVVPTAEPDPVRRAARHAAVLLTLGEGRAAGGGQLHLRLAEGADSP